TRPQPNPRIYMADSRSTVFTENSSEQYHALPVQAPRAIPPPIAAAVGAPPPPRPSQVSQTDSSNGYSESGSVLRRNYASTPPLVDQYECYGDLQVGPPSQAYSHIPNSVIRT